MTACQCELREPGDFQNWAEIEALEKALEAHQGWREVPVSQPYGGGVGFSERWFKSTGCGHLWRLVYPDGPFSGLWEQIH